MLCLVPRLPPAGDGARLRLMVAEECGTAATPLKSGVKQSLEKASTSPPSLHSNGQAPKDIPLPIVMATEYKHTAFVNDAESPAAHEVCPCQAPEIDHADADHYARKQTQ
jgi:hypothetical protein